MTARQREKLRLALQKLRAQALAAAPAPIEPNRRDETQVGVADEDAQALSEMLQVLNSQRNKGHAQTLARIDRALRKLAAAPEDFGLCEECEEPIPLARLELVPYAALCTGCQKKHDPRRGGVRRKLGDVQ